MSVVGFQEGFRGVFSCPGVDDDDDGVGDGDGWGGNDEDAEDAEDALGRDGEGNTSLTLSSGGC